MANPKKREEQKSEFEERVVNINRSSKVVKGGRRFSFGALVVVGDRKGRVGYALGKANEVADAIRKATEMARRDMEPVAMNGDTVPHDQIGEFTGARVLIRPASPGTGVIAGGAVRAVLELAGYKDVIAKSLGSSNHLNVTKAALCALRKMRTREEALAARQL
ncbi:30S ribosomal protein S5 [Kiritimatiella glycovorans]|uniref:Small ribosomal subunit protein uS5 n=1 Tax=Kiritimatiella glycovorans TaxID=1307763 RepID=A0A0G3EJH5_9BACT|nr:30S ribosomal protein S5 [Kiritimatiella glycovorans]AKJ64940.1 30S ribosomal protein S5 [Kiritimatiella glycovorans]